MRISDTNANGINIDQTLIVCVAPHREPQRMLLPSIPETPAEANKALAMNSQLRDMAHLIAMGDGRVLKSVSNLRQTRIQIEELILKGWLLGECDCTMHPDGSRTYYTMTCTTRGDITGEINIYFDSEGVEIGASRLPLSWNPNTPTERHYEALLGNGGKGYTPLGGDYLFADEARQAVFEARQAVQKPAPRWARGTTAEQDSRPAWLKDLSDGGGRVRARAQSRNIEDSEVVQVQMRNDRHGIVRMNGIEIGAIYNGHEGWRVMVGSPGQRMDMAIDGVFDLRDEAVAALVDTLLPLFRQIHGRGGIESGVPAF